VGANREGQRERQREEAERGGAEAESETGGERYSDEKAAKRNVGFGETAACDRPPETLRDDSRFATFFNAVCVARGVRTARRRRRPRSEPPPAHMGQPPRTWGSTSRPWAPGR
jgi:hypothetical protein